MTLREWSMLGALALMWGSAFMFTKLALAGAAPMELAAVRTVFGLVILGGAGIWIARVRRDSASFPPPVRLFWLGLTGAALPFLLMSWGQQHIESALAGILVSAVPVFTVVLGHFIEGETKMTRWSVAGVLAGLCGVALIIGPGALGGLTEGLLGQLAIIAAAFGYAIAALIGRRLSGHSPVFLGVGQMIVSSIVILPLFVLSEGWQLPELTGPAWFWALALAVFASALPPIFMFRLLRTVTATQLSLVSYLIPVVALAWGILLFGETLRVEQIAGFALILGSLWAINRRSG